ncbi:TPA: recombinase family protein [Escherichia coli]
MADLARPASPCSDAINGQETFPFRAWQAHTSSDSTVSMRAKSAIFSRTSLSLCSARLLAFVREGDTVVVHSMDRLARNLDDLRRIVQGLTQRGVRMEFVKEGLKFTGEDSPMANLMLSVMGAFAEFERALIRERQREGIVLAKQRGAYRGRKKSLNSEQIAELKRRVAAGDQKTLVARDFGISRETLYQYLRED